MDKIEKGIWLFDDGKKYYYKTNEGNNLEFDHGYLLMKSAIIMKNHNMSALYKGFNTPKEHSEDIASVTELVNYIVRSGVKREIWEIVSEEEREIFVKVVASELVRIGQGDRNELSQIIFNDKELAEDLEKILLGEFVEENRLGDILMLDKLEYVNSLQNGEYLQGYKIDSMGQLISLEVLNVLRNKNAEIIYRRCICCKQLFKADIGPGRPQMVCRYEYSKGPCKIERQKSLDKDRNPIEIQDRKINDRIRNMIKNHGIKHKNLHEKFNDYEKYSSQLKLEGVLEEEYVNLTNQWYKEIEWPWK